MTKQALCLTTVMTVIELSGFALAMKSDASPMTNMIAISQIQPFLKASLRIFVLETST